jgi:flotillin
MMTAIYLGIGILLLVILTIVGLMTRYKKCGSDEVLVVYGKTKGNGAAKCYHGGATFVWPIIQGWDKLSMKPADSV